MVPGYRTLHSMMPPQNDYNGHDSSQRVARQPLGLAPVLVIAAQTTAYNQSISQHAAAAWLSNRVVLQLPCYSVPNTTAGL